MSGTLKLYIAFLVLLFGVIIYIDYNKPKPINWNPTYKLSDKIPFGLYIFDQEVQSLLGNDSIEKVSKTAYEYFVYDNNSEIDEYKTVEEEDIVFNDSVVVYDETINDSTIEYVEEVVEPNDTLNSNYQKGTIFSISDNYEIDGESTEFLLDYAKQGNTVFISSNNFEKMLQDSLKFDIDAQFPGEEGLDLSMANSKLGIKKYNFKTGAGNLFFKKIDTLNTTILGYQFFEFEKKKEKNINFIKVPYGKGFFYLHTQPVAFTNYHLLKDDHKEYVEKICSYLPKSKMFWLTKNAQETNISYSPMRYILSQPALKYTWYIFLIGIIIFMIFNAKRKQRVVPIIKPLPNTTVDFTKTIGNLYYQEGNHQNLIDKKIVYFLEKIRNEYLIDTHILDDVFIKKLHLKSGKNLEDIQNVVRLINYQRSSLQVSTENDLLEINKAIEKII